MGSAMLELRDLNVYYGAIHALRGVSVTVNEGEIVTLIGANGAGKSTLLRTASGMIRAKSGSVTFKGEDITKTSASQIVSRRLVHCPEGRRVFAGMSVKENLELGGFLRKDKAGLKNDYDSTLEMFPRLKERLTQQAGTLSGGEQQMLAIGRAIMTKPKLLMLDEPSLGLAPLIVRDIFRIIQKINQEGVAILLVEQNANQALAIANRGYVIETGQIALEDDAQALRTNPKVKEAYLGA
jgi:branched-chain amino acid transport system ATP-binding protein